MSFKLKAAIAAVGLALASGHAAAANWASADSATGGELFAVVYDTASHDAFVLDLNTTFSDMVANGKTAGYSLSFDLGSNANFASFLSAATGDDGGSAPTLAYYIAGGNTNTNSYFMTDTTAPSVANSGQVNTLGTPIKNWMNNSGIRNAVLAGGGSAFVSSQTAFNPLHDANQFTNSWDSKLQNNQRIDGTVNNPLFWYQMSRQSSSIAPAVVTQYGSAAGAATWLLSQDANGVSLTYSVPAVPEPGTWALMAAGLLFVAGMARRRTSV